MSLRTRLALVLAAILVGPLLAAWVAVGVLVPQTAATAASSHLQRAAAATAAYLGEQCRGLGDAGRAVAAAATAAPASADAAVDRAAVDRAAVARAATEAAARRPSMTVLVTVGDQVVAGAGPLATTVDQALGPAGLRGLRDASCARRTAPATSLPALAESVPVLDRSGREVGRVTAVQPLDAAQLTAFRDVLGLGTELALIAPSSTTAGARVLSATAPLPALAGVAAQLPSGAAGTAAGEAAGYRYRVQAAPAGVPYEVLAVSAVEGRRPQLVMLATVLGFVAIFGALLIWIASRLTSPLVRLTRTAQQLGRGDLTARSGVHGSDEVGTLAAALDSMAVALQRQIGQIQAGQDALAQTFQQFGEALGHTHDLDGLLRTIVEAAKQGSSACIGTALLGDGDQLQERITSVPDGSDGRWVGGVVDGLAELAREAVRRREVLVTELGPDAGPAVAAPLLRGEHVVGALATARRAGEAAFDEVSLAAVTALAGHAGTAVGNVREHQDAQRLSVTDPLTGVGNFRQLSSTLNREVERASRFARPLSVLMLDMDHFKQVNDTHGHAFGDAVLREFARRLSGCVREVDLVARYGGEEFAIVLPETGAAGAQALASRICQLVRGEPVRALGQARQVTVSIGIASYPEDGEATVELLRSADAALYVAKRAGRDRWAAARQGEGDVPAGRAPGIALE